MSQAKAAAKRPVSNMTRRQNRYGYGFIMLWLIGLFVFTLIPMLFSLFLSFCKWDIVTGLSTIKFIGLENFQKIFDDRKFYKALEVTFKFCLISIPFYQIASLLVAMLLNMRIKFMRTFRLIFFLPSIIPTIASSMIWTQILGKDGLINQGLALIGIQGPAWLNTPSTALYGLILMGVWGIGNTIIIYLSGLQGVGEELYEASSIDGANSFQRFFKITLPMVSPTLFVVLIMRLMASIKVYDLIYMMVDQTNPALTSAQSLMYLFYRESFVAGNRGYASAIVIWTVALIGIITALQFWGQKKWVNYEV